MVTEKTIKQLIRKNGSPKVTLTFPTEKIGIERRQNPIRLKNQLTKAAEKLKSQGMKVDEVETFLKPARQLLDQSLFWSEMGYGMVIYIAPGYFEVFKLPYDTSEMIYVDRDFLITPLLPMISIDGSYFILAISLKQIRLLHCSRTSITDVTPEELPANFGEWLGEKPEQQIQFHTGANEGEKAIYFGHGANEEDQKEIAEEYLREVEKSATRVMNQFQDPMLPAGLSENIALYRKVNHYGRVLDNNITHNPDELSDTQLRDRGWSIIKDFFLNDLFESLENYRESSLDRVSTDPSEIIPSTVMGKTGTIFITKDLVRWGKYDTDNHKVYFKNQPENGDVDLMNWLSIKGIETGSNVYVLPKDEMPEHAELAALFRF